MRRYKFLTQKGVYTALNKLRAAFLAAKNGSEVEEIIMGVLTYDERMKIGRRIQISQALRKGLTLQEIKAVLKVGTPTIVTVEKKIRDYPHCFDLIEKRETKVEKVFNLRVNEKSGGSTMIFKKRAYHGYKRKYIER